MQKIRRAYFMKLRTSAHATTAATRQIFVFLLNKQPLKLIQKNLANAMQLIDLKGFYVTVADRQIRMFAEGDYGSPELLAERLRDQVMRSMRSKKARIRAVPVRVTPVTAAVATALGSFVGMDLAAAATPEVVVSATRRDTSVQDVPYSISAISGETIDDLQVRGLADIARWTPGLTLIDQGTREANQLIIRGLNSDAIMAPELLRNSQGDRVGTYFGETPVYINLAPVDLERVEVLHGPQGTLYGSRSLGGTVRYVPNAPQTDEMTIDGHLRGFDLSKSDDVGYDVDAVINVPLIENTLALRAVVTYMNSPGFIDQPFVVNEPGVSCPEPFFSDPGCTDDDLRYEKDTNDEETTSVRGSLLWNISSNFSATLSYLFQRNESGGRQINSRDSMAVITDPGTMEPLDIGKYASGMRFLETNERDNSIANLTFNYDLGGAEFLSTTSYIKFDQEGTRDQTDLLLLYGYGDFPAFSAYTEDTTDDKTLTQEFRLVSNDENSRVDYILGMFYQDADLQQGSNEFAPNFNLWGTPQADGQVTFVDVKRDTKELAVFGELGYDLTDRLHLLAGARWFDVDDDIVSCIQFTLFDPSPACDEGGGSDDDVIYKLGTDFRINDDALLYALFSQGISLGGINPGAFVPDEYRFVKPEKANNYEVGVRSVLGNGGVTLNAAAFWIDWEDIHVLDIISGFTLTTNGGKARTNGVEIEIDAALNDHWTLNAGVTLTEAKITSPGPTYHERLPGSPQETLNLGVSYNTQLSNNLDLDAAWQMTAVSDVATFLGGDDVLSGFAVHHASVGVSNETWQATLFANNLFDKYAVTGVRDERLMIGTDGSANDFALRRYFQNVLTPRTVGVDLRYRFK